MIQSIIGIPFSLQVILSLFFAFFVTSLAMPYYVRVIIRKMATQSINTYLEHTGDHAKKNNTPTMGGFVIVFSSLLSFFLFGNIFNPLCQIVIFSGICFTMIGFTDDYAKIKNKTNKGIMVKARLYLEFGTSILTLLLVRKVIGEDYYGKYLFFKSFTLNIGFLYFFMQLFAITGTSNATNMTDGLDGLVALPAVICFCFFGYTIANLDLLYQSSYEGFLFLSRINQMDVNSLCVLCSSISGSVLGFLLFNAKPAKIFMGDTGSLFLGSTMATIAVITKTELILAIAGGLFVCETVSVIIQITSVKLRKKRVFLITPIHHHFERKGWTETQIVTRFYVVALLFTFVALFVLHY